jgi:CheY-like chemotaxis protein
MNGSSNKRRILFVDDDVEYLQVLDRLLRLWSKNELEVLTTSDASKALALVQDQPLDLIVLDLCMPVVDGLQFLSILNRRFPGLPKVVLTGFATEAYRAACLSNGAELFLEKPRTSEGLESIFATLNEVARWKPEPGFRGVLRRVGLIDVIQMECLGKSSSLLSITSPSKNGQIFIRDGSIIHAQCGQSKGEPAFRELLSLASGDFRLNPFSEPAEETISGSWEGLLMDAAQSSDEKAEPEPAPEIQLRQPEPVEESAEQTDPEPAVTEELMICSEAGDVFHAWQCPNTDLRVSFLEFLSQKARLLLNVLPLGEFDRAEFHGLASRLVARICDGRGIVLRTRECADPAPSESRSAASPPPPERKEFAQNWFQEHLELPGLLAATLQFSDRSGAIHSVSPKFAPDSLESLKRCMADGFQVLRLQRFSARRARWLYSETAVESAQWQDGTIVTLVFSRQSFELNSRLIETTLGGFFAAELQVESSFSARP